MSCLINQDIFLSPTWLKAVLVLVDPFTRLSKRNHSLSYFPEKSVCAVRRSRKGHMQICHKSVRHSCIPFCHILENRLRVAILMRLYFGAFCTNLVFDLIYLLMSWLFHSIFKVECKLCPCMHKVFHAWVCSARPWIRVGICESMQGKISPKAT